MYDLKLNDYLMVSEFLRDKGPELVETLANNYVNETIGQIDDYVLRVVNFTTNMIGRCEPLSNSYNATVVAVCNEIVDPFNGFWASIGWCYFFYLPSIALAIGKYRIVQSGIFHL